MNARGHILTVYVIMPSGDSLKKGKNLEIKSWLDAKNMAWPKN